jgi:ATP-dependent protease ClpP protease subunit
MKTAKMRLKPSFKASLQDDGVLELTVYEDIGEDWWSGGGVTAKSVKQKFDAAGAFSRIVVRINSPGGDAFEGVAICSLLRSQGKPVDVYVDGIAASAASIIAMAGDTITMGRSAMMMVHNAWTVCAGDGDDMRKCADTLDTISLSIGQTYVAKTGKTAAEIKAIMDAETWMGAEECVDEGFATAIAEDSAQEEAAMALAASFKSLAKLRNVPASLKPVKADASGCACPCEPCMDGNCADCGCDGCNSEDCTADLCECANNVDDSAKTPKDSNLSLYEARLKLCK